MSVTLSKRTHGWLCFVEENLIACRFCGTALYPGQDPATDACTPNHDAACVCDGCNPPRYEAGQMVEILTDGETDYRRTFGEFLPQGEVVEILPNGRIKVQPGTVAYPLRSYTLNFLPGQIRHRAPRG
ncbi:hypothetical protein [Streptomyces sp. DH10]|uniref:hypothetical protein n=1 Tax=Streptomyces sp. DH10 TaxID=3040121 RepID=UPI00244339C4|nr:hypothetical protein [Streptomyces sp. DH10]MDG9711147.1 hypothetical protein [Streptomyces sp. DH10]